MSDADHTLLVMRHAAAEPAGTGQPDVERALSARGRDQARARATLVATRAPELVLCSTAVRTRQTLALLDLPGTPTRFEDVIYSGGATEVLDLLRTVPADVACVLLIGHMPTVAYLTAALTDTDPQTLEFGTATVAEVEVPGSWVSLGPAAARLRGLHGQDR